MGSTWVVQGREGCTGRVSIVEAVEGAVVVEVVEDVTRGRGKFLNKKVRDFPRSSQKHTKIMFRREDGF